MANGLNLQSSGLTFTTGDVVRNIITDTGRSGLGILSPDAMLHVKPTGATPSVKFEGLASGTDVRVLASDANGVVSYRSDVLVGGSISNNVITLTESDAGTTNLTVQAVTAVTYNNAWDIALDGTGTIGTTPVALPFITGGTYSNGTITLGINGDSSESDITISGIDGDDTFVTGATFSSGTATLTRNDGVDVDITGIWTSIPNSALTNDDVTIGTTAIALGASSTTLAGLTSVTSASFSGPLTGNVTGNASTASALQTGRDIAITGDITAVGVTFDGSQNISLSASIDAGVVDTTELANDAVTTAKILDANVTNAKLANDSFTAIGTTGSNSDIALGGSLTFTSTDGSVVVTGDGSGSLDLAVGSGVDTFSTGGTFSNGTLTIDLNDNSDFDVTGLWTNIPNSALINDSVTIGITAIDLGASSTTLAGLTQVDSLLFVGPLQGNADTASSAAVWTTARTLSLGTDLSGSVSIDGSQDVTLNASLGAGVVDTAELATNAVTTVKITDGNVTNAKLANDSISVTDGTTSSDIALGGTLTFDDGTGLDVSQAGGTVTYSIDSSVVTLNGTQTLTNKTINGSQLVDASVSNAKLANSAITLIGDSGVNQTISLGDSMTFVGGSGIDFVGANTDTMNVNLDNSVVQFKSEKGQVNGYASLDANGRVPVAQLPSSVFTYEGNWDAATNTPTLANGTGDPGMVYRVSVAGAQLGETWEVGDLAIYDGAVWQKSDSLDAVQSVNSQTGVVILDADDISDSGTTNKWDQTVVLTSGTGISATGTYPNFTITNTDLGSSQTFFKTFNVDNGSAVVANANNDSMTITSSDSSVTITGNGSDEIDITVGASVNTNIYNTDGTLAGNRTVNFGGNSLAFTAGDFTVDGTTLSVDQSQNAVGIGVAAPDASAVLEVASTSKGFLFPRMTEAERGLIGSPATGLMVYQTDGDEGVYIKKSFGWVQVI